MKITMYKKIMTAAQMVALTTLGPISLSAIAQMNIIPAERSLKQPLVRQFKACVSPTGLTRDLPLADPSPSLEGSGTLYTLGDMGAIRDGYKHYLMLSADNKQIYIVQVGGFAGTQKIFGPLDPQLHCVEVTPKNELNLPEPSFQKK
jgi:hypothetical protein